MKKFFGFYTWKNLLKSFWISLLISTVVWAVFFSFQFTVGQIVFFVLLVLAGPGLMAREAAIRESEEESGMDRL